jgi:hypothetical protein
MSRFRILVLVPFLYWIAGLSVPTAAQEQNELQKKNPDLLDRNSYRVKVHPVLEPTKTVAVYHVQIMTAEKCGAWLHSFGGATTRELVSRPEKGSKLFRADFVLVVSLRDIGKGDGTVELEFRYIVGGSEGMTSLTWDVSASTQLSDVFALSIGESAQKLGEKKSIGQFRGKALEVEADRK